jgi:LAO/AO transport system kinase
MAGPAPTLQDIRAGGKPALARALSAIEGADGGLRHAELLDAAAREARAQRIGLTGPPGVGKSTLTNLLVRGWRERSVSVAVVAVDPSSQISGGALLGDRTRITTDPDDAGVFVRSFAARDRLGGLSDHALAAVHLLSAFFDRVLVESVGIGQSESDLAHAVDTLVLCVQPGSGDALQFMKAGIMELPDVVAVTKADMQRDARRTLADVEGALSLAPAHDVLPVAVLAVSSVTGEGLDALGAACDAHWRALAGSGRLARKRRQQSRHWLADAVRRRYGVHGIRLLGSVAEDRLDEAGGLYHAIGHACTSIEERFR